MLTAERKQQLILENARHEGDTVSEPAFSAGFFIFLLR